MKSSRLGLGVVLASLTYGSAALALTQPNGTTIPVGVSLQSLFDSRGETPLNALSDAAILPETFVPACGLTFEVLRRGAVNRNSFGWYNVTGARPAVSDLHEFIACTDVVNTIRPLDIRSSPAYLGGEIGFYQATGECATLANHTYIFYSQRAFNPDGAGASAYIHLLIYNSIATPNAFYFGWEDLLSGGDNDFDDLATFVSGITCSGGGGPCTTGNAGICSDGTMQCQNGALSCVPSNAPKAEECNGLDDDCDGLIDNGNGMCSSDKVCDKGQCKNRCGNGEFGCLPDEVCSPSGVCVEPNCLNVTCPEGEICTGGLCKGPCDGVTCPFGQVCRVGACVDPCASITCDLDQICSAGACIDRCQCTGCPTAQTCEASGACTPDICAGVVCPAGYHCSDTGTCVDNCVGAVCPPGETCDNGGCIESPTTTSTGDGAGGDFNPFPTTTSGGGSGGSNSGGAGGSGGVSEGGDGFTPKTRSSCNCLVAGGTEDGESHGWKLPFAGLLGLVAGLRRLARRG